MTKLTTEEKQQVEELRINMHRDISSNNRTREQLEKEEGKVWDSDELGGDYTVIGFGAPFVVVRRKSDGVEGSLLFQHHPRLYWGWQEDRV